MELLLHTNTTSIATWCDPNKFIPVRILVNVNTHIYIIKRAFCRIRARIRTYVNVALSSVVLFPLTAYYTILCVMRIFSFHHFFHSNVYAIFCTNKPSHYSYVRICSYMVYRPPPPPPSKHEILTLYWVEVGPTSSTLAQH